MGAATIILGVLCGVFGLYEAYDSWADGVVAGFEAREPFPRSVHFRALYIAGYRIGADAREAWRLERLSRGDR